MKKLTSVAALLGSFATIVCCFLPAVFVTLGFGAAFASLIGAFPQITWLSENKSWVFFISAVLISIAAIFQWRSRYTACPIDPELAEGCGTAKSYSKRIFIFAAVLYLLGFSFAFFLPALMS